MSGVSRDPVRPSGHWSIATSASVRLMNDRLSEAVSSPYPIRGQDSSPTPRPHITKTLHRSFETCAAYLTERPKEMENVRGEVRYAN